MEKQNESSIIKSGPDKEKPEIPKTRKFIAATAYSGPLPPPELFVQYEQVLPGAADRILAMVEKQSQHRQTKELIQVKSESRDSLLGIICALIIGLSVIAGGVCIAIIGKQPWPGMAFGATSIAGLVGVFIYGTKSSRYQFKNKYESKIED